jgi:hypothetical protein
MGLAIFRSYLHLLSQGLKNLHIHRSQSMDKTIRAEESLSSPIKGKEKRMEWRENLSIWQLSETKFTNLFISPEIIIIWYIWQSNLDAGSVYPTQCITNTEKMCAYNYIHTNSTFRTPKPSVRAMEDGKCVRLRGQCIEICSFPSEPKRQYFYSNSNLAEEIA